METVTRRPAVPGLYAYDAHGRPNPLSSKCEACGARAFPARDVCEDCFSPDLTLVELGSTGTLHAFTIVHETFGPGSLPLPYGLGILQFEDGFQIRGLLNPDCHAWIVGQAVETIEIPLERDGETELMTYALTPRGANDA